MYSTKSFKLAAPLLSTLVVFSFIYKHPFTLRRRWRLAFSWASMLAAPASTGRGQDTRCPVRSCKPVNGIHEWPTTLAGCLIRPSTLTPTRCLQRPWCMSANALRAALAWTAMDRVYLESSAEALSTPDSLPISWTPTTADSGDACRRSSPNALQALGADQEGGISRAALQWRPPAQHHSILSASCSSFWWGIAWY